MKHGVIIVFALLLISVSCIRVKPGSTGAYRHLTARGSDRTSSPGVFDLPKEDATALASKVPLELDDPDATALRVQRIRELVAARDSNPYLGLHSHNRLLALLRSTARENAGLVSLVSVGTSVENRNMEGVRLSRCPNHRCPEKPAVALMGPVHGDEVVGREMLINFIALLVEGDGVNANVTEILDAVDLIIVPDLNPDGFAALTRTNAHGVDLNRDYPSRCDDYSAKDVEPETAATMAFVINQQPNAMMWFHGGSEVVSYPYDNKCGSHGRHPYAAHPHDAMLREYSKAYSLANARMVRFGHTFKDGVTNGAHWYPLKGGAQDWALGYVPSVLFSATAEVSFRKHPSAKDIASKYWPANLPAMVAFVYKFKQGIHARIVDSVSHKPVEGGVILYKGVRSPADSTTGWIHYPIEQGRHEVVVVAPSYVGRRVHVNVEDGVPISRVFTLTRMPSRRYAPDGPQDMAVPYIEED